jgi:hypothetical protein
VSSSSVGGRHPFAHLSMLRSFLVPSAVAKGKNRSILQAFIFNHLSFYVVHGFALFNVFLFGVIFVSPFVHLWKSQIISAEELPRSSFHPIKPKRLMAMCQQVGGEDW